MKLRTVIAWSVAMLLLAASAAAQRVSVPAGANLQVRIIENLSSDKSHTGDVFHGTLAEPLVVNGRTVFAKGADVTGTVLKAHPSGRLSDPGVLELELTEISDGRGRYPISAPPIVLKGQSHTKSNVTKIGGGAAAGAILGAILGGGKGAAIGAGAGAAAGTGVAAATGKKDSKVESEAILQWTTSEPINASSARARSGYARRQGGQSEMQSYDDARGARSGETMAAQRGSPEEFSARDRQMIRSCFQSNRAGLPPGLAKRDRLPPGLERQVQRNGTLPPGLQKRVQPLPGVCTAQLPRLPGDWVRVILGDRVLLLDRSKRILDLFRLSDSE